MTAYVNYGDNKLRPAEPDVWVTVVRGVNADDTHTHTKRAPIPDQIGGRPNQRFAHPLCAIPSALINRDVRALLSFFFNNLTYIISPVDEDDDEDDDTLNMGIMQCIKYAAQS